MIIQNIVFPKYGICSEYDLYFRLSNNSNYSHSNMFLFMPDGNWCHFDTYFNGFMIRKWKKYTTLDNLKLSIKMMGSFRITILYKDRLFNGEVINKKIKEVELSSEKIETFDIPIQINENVGMYTFSIYSLKNGSIFYGGYYGTDLENNKKVKLGICICTFKRETFVRNNVENIVSNIIGPEDNAEVFISDNAKTLTLKTTNPHIHIISNINAGGAGGFTRCMIEIMAHPEYDITHLLMMDDDIVFDCESILRTLALLKLLKPDLEGVCIGGAMLRLDQQSIQTESGAVWNGGRLISRKNNLNLSTCEACLYNDIEESVEYNAWWYCCIPRSFINEENLPVPIFFRGDDVEYGLRNTKIVINMNGICVWHEPFENKYSSTLSYYIIRNRLIDNSVRNIPVPVNEMIKDIRNQWLVEMALLRYKNAHLLVDGILDYLKGIDWLISVDVEKLNSEIISKGYKLVQLNDIDYEFNYEDYIKASNYSSSSLIVKMADKYISGRTEVITIPVNYVNVHYCYKAKQILNYDYHSGKGFMTEYSKEEEKNETKYFKNAISYFRKKYKTVFDEYRDRSPEITNLAFWNKYLKLDD